MVSSLYQKKYMAFVLIWLLDGGIQGSKWYNSSILGWSRLLCMLLPLYMVALNSALERCCKFSRCQKGQTKHLALSLMWVWPGPGCAGESGPCISSHSPQRAGATPVTKWTGGLIFKLVFLLFVFGTYEEKNVPLDTWIHIKLLFS